MKGIQPYSVFLKIETANQAQQYQIPTLPELYIKKKTQPTSYCIEEAQSPSSKPGHETKTSVPTQYSTRNFRKNNQAKKKVKDKQAGRLSPFLRTEKPKVLTKKVVRNKNIQQ